MRLHPGTSANSATSPSTDELRLLRQDLRRLVALEALQRAFATGVLVTIAARAVFVARERPSAVAIAIATLLALTHLALSFRLRAGQELLRRDLCFLELRQEARAHAGALEAHPYRCRPPSGGDARSVWRRSSAPPAKR